MKNLRLLIILVLSLFICSSAFASNQELADEVMAIHDEAMAKMTHMHELKLQLKEMEKEKGTSESNTAAIADLQSAHKGMMVWMREYKKPDTPEKLESAKPYLLDEKVKIQKVSDDINTSIEQAENLLQ